MLKALHVTKEEQLKYCGRLVIHLFHFKNLGSLSEKRVVISYCKVFSVLSRNVEYLTRTSVQ